MKQYEITFITKEDLKEKPVKADIEALGGKILNISSIGQKQFTYTIKKEKAGIYTTVVFEIAPEKLMELNHKLSLKEDILRHLIILYKAAKVEVPRLPKPEKTLPEPLKELEAPKEEIIKEKPLVKKAEPKKKVVKAPKPSKEAEKIEEETISEEERLKELDKKLDELLKE